MAEQTQTRPGMSLDDFLQRADNERFEILDGEIVEMAPVKFGHSETGKFIYDALRDYLKENPVGEVFAETVFVLEDTPQWVKGSRVPDVMFIEGERLREYKATTEDYREKPLVLVPDFVVEIISPTDKYVRVEQKITLYLEDGVRLIWIVDPENQTVKVYEGSSQVESFQPGDTLSGHDVLPGFTLSVAAVLDV